MEAATLYFGSLNLQQHSKTKCQICEASGQFFSQAWRLPLLMHPGKMFCEKIVMTSILVQHTFRSIAAMMDGM
jgi:hypothetical protein